MYKTFALYYTSRGALKSGPFKKTKGQRQFGSRLRGQIAFELAVKIITSWPLFALKSVPQVQTTFTQNVAEKVILLPNISQFNSFSCFFQDGRSLCSWHAILFDRKFSYLCKEDRVIKEKRIHFKAIAQSLSM